MLPVYKRILVASDFTENSHQAFKHAVMLARHNNAKLYMVHVVPQVDPAMRSYISSVMGEGNLEKFEHSNIHAAHDELKKELVAFARRELADFPEDWHRFAGVEVVAGAPVFKILEVAEKLDVDLIVMGSHGKGPLKHAFLGSVAEKVLKKSHRPVFVVPLAP